VSSDLPLQHLLFLHQPIPLLLQLMRPRLLSSPSLLYLNNPILQPLRLFLFSRQTLLILLLLRQQHLIIFCCNFLPEELLLLDYLPVDFLHLLLDVAFDLFLSFQHFLLVEGVDLP
jgi:hypothetical protein